MFFNDFFDILDDAEHENESPTNSSPVPNFSDRDKKNFEPWYPPHGYFCASALSAQKTKN